MTPTRKTLILGGSSGIGEAAAAAFMAAGHDVIIASRSAGKLAQARSRLGDVETIEVDTTDPASVAALMQAAGTIDHLVLTAGGRTPTGPFAEIGAQGLEAVMTDKLLVQARVAQAAIPHLSKSGSITFTGGIAGQKAVPGMSAAAAANMALEALSRSLAAEIAPVRVNIVVPGLVDTPAYSEMPDDMRKGLFAGAASSLPVGRVGLPSDIGAAILAIATNGYMTGSSVVIDGGGHL